MVPTDPNHRSDKAGWLKNPAQLHQGPTMGKLLRSHLDLLEARRRALPSRTRLRAQDILCQIHTKYFRWANACRVRVRLFV